MLTKAVVYSAACCLFLAPSVIAAEEWLTMPPDMAQIYGKVLTGHIEKVKEQQVKVDPVPTESIGLAFKGGGIVLVPAKHFNDVELGKNVESETGVPVGYLFLTPSFNPLEAGKKIDPKKFRTIQYEDDGDAKDVTALIVTVRHVQGDDWRLYVYGADKKPLLDIKFFEADDELDKKLAMRVQDVDEGKGTLVITILKKYEASIEIGQ